MTLGKQFENTFWHDNDGGITASVRNEGSNEPSIKKLSNESGTPLQGMLFPPATATGRRDDPLVPHEKRMSAIRTALHVDDVDNYRRNLRNLVPSQKLETSVKKTDKEGNVVNDSRTGYPLYVRTSTTKQSETSAKKYMGMLADALDNTDYPTHEIQKTDARAVVDPKPGRAHVDAVGGGIKMNIRPGGKTVSMETVPSNRFEPDTTKPIHNPKFWGQIVKHMDYDQHDYTSDEVVKHATHWHNPTTGHTIHRDDLDDWSEKQPAPNDDLFSETAGQLKDQGYVPNLFPGKGEHGVKHSAGDTHDIEVGYGNSDYQQYRTRKYHNRFEPDSSKSLKGTTLQKVTRSRPPSISTGTLVHEVGHTRDINLKDKYHIWSHHKTAFADPMLEGVADGFQDRHSRYAGQFDDVLSHSDDRVETIKSTGYSSEHGGWKNNTHRALYAATRFHSALGDTNSEGIPSREKLAENYLTANEKSGNWSQTHGRDTTEAGRKHGDLVNTLALGHIYEHQPHVREHLDAHGYGGVAKKAHAEYLDRAKKRGTLLSGNQFEDHKVESSQLPGLENY